MRRINILVLAVVLLGGAGCQGATVPERRDLRGSWTSRNFAEGTFRMTLAETAREVVGAGSWLTSARADAFEVSGALAIDEVSLYFRFDGQSDLNFQGYFEEDDVMVGHLTGEGFRRQSITFEREDLAP